MSELEQYHREHACAGAWADPDKALCGCRGRGWWLSEVDTTHRCRYHYDGQPHPEEEDAAVFAAYDAWVAAGRPAPVPPPPPGPVFDICSNEPPPLADDEMPF